MEAGNVTGRKDQDYNLIWFTEQCLSNALRMESYARVASHEQRQRLSHHNPLPA